MHNSKLIELLKSFSASELREFKDFVASPFFNKNEELSLFYAYLKTSYIVNYRLFLDKDYNTTLFPFIKGFFGLGEELILLAEN